MRGVQKGKEECKMKRNFLQKLIFVLLIATWSLMIPQSLVIGQVLFPTHPVTIWVGFPPGGGTDIITRALAEGVGKNLGQKIVVINKAGGGATVCASLLAKEKPDGYTIAAFTDSPATRGPHLMVVDYDPLKDFSYIIRVGLWKNAFVVRADSPFKKWEEVVDWAKKNPGQLTYGHSGIGTSLHLGMVKVAKKEGFIYRDVPFAGEAPSVSAILGGHVMVMGLSAMTLRSQVEAKTVRVLLGFEREGLGFAPDVPTFEKMHYDFEFQTAVIICAPKGIPDPVKEILENAFINGMQQETFRKVAKDQELLLTEPLKGKALLDYIRKWNRVYEQSIKEAGIYKTEKK